MKKTVRLLILMVIMILMIGCGKQQEQGVQNVYVQEGTYKLKYIPYFYEEVIEKDVPQKRTFEFLGMEYETEYERSHKCGYDDMVTHFYRGSKKQGEETINCIFQVIDGSDKLYWEMASYKNTTNEEGLSKEEIVKIVNDYASQYISVDDYEMSIEEGGDYSIKYSREYGEYKAYRYLWIDCNKKGIIEMVIKEPILELDDEYIMKKLENFDNDKCLEMVEKLVEKQTGEKPKDIYEQYLTAVDGELVMRYSVITAQKDAVVVMASWD